MSKTKIEWTEYSWNPVTGCTPISEGCRNCYAARMAKRLAGRCGYPKENPFKVTLHPERLDEPLRWRKPSRVFVCSMGDLFHEFVPTKFIIDCLSIMAEAYQHTFMILTKRPERMRAIMSHETIANDVWLQTSRGVNAEPSPWPLPNVWLGVTAESQEQAVKRIPVLLQIPAAVRFVSVEPMLGPMDLTRIDLGCNTWVNALIGNWKSYHPYGGLKTVHESWGKLDCVICGGETGPGARPMHPDWVRSLRDQCQAARVPFFFKQWGEWGPVPTEGVPVRGCMDNGKFHFGPNPGVGLAMYRVGKKAAGRLLDGQIWDEMPELDGQRWAQWPEATS